MTRRHAALTAVAVVVLGGCGGGGKHSDERVDSATTSVASTLSDTTVPATVADTEATEPAPTAAPTTSPTTTVAEGVIPGTATIAVLTQGAGLGARPLLRWEPVEGAVNYVVSVNAPNGGPLWAWEGPVNEVAFGGGPADDPDTTGAQLVGPATWFVAGLDADGRVLASSVPVDLAP